MFPFETMLRNHMQYNAYPPIHSSWYEYLVQAIEACVNDEGDTIITDNKTASSICDECYLWDFVASKNNETLDTEE